MPESLPRPEMFSRWSFDRDAIFIDDVRAEVAAFMKQTFSEHSSVWSDVTADDSPRLADGKKAKVFNYSPLVYSRLRPLGMTACAKLARIIVEDYQDAKLGINYQQPFAAQILHQDFKRKPVTTVHLDDNGAFDYCMQQYDDEYSAMQNLESIEDIEAGEAVTQYVPCFPHRGRNRGGEDRFTLSVYTV